MAEREKIEKTVGTPRMQINDDIAPFHTMLYCGNIKMTKGIAQ